MTKSPQTPESFWAVGVRVGPCLEWPGGRSNWGYGRLWYQGKTWNASRLAWTLARSPIPPGLNVLHTCDNPACYEPLHLFLGTLSDNQRDASAKGKRTARYGLQNSHGRFTPDQVREMRHLRAEGWTFRRIGDRFQTQGTVVWGIVSGRSQSHVT